MSEVSLRSVTAQDAVLLHSLARACPPLGVHTHYTYWVQAAFFGQECFVLELDGRPVGFITSVTAGDRQLIWQIGVLQEHRGRGYSRLLIDAVLRTAVMRGRTEVEFSIAPGNDASLAAFRGYAEKEHLEMVEAGSLRLTDPDDPHFLEFEHVYALTLPGANRV